jgi:hypothetical protein
MKTFDRTWCLNLLDEIVKWPIAKPFLNPIDPVVDDCPNYEDIVTKPMDFSEIRKKCTQNVYASVQAFVDDIRLISSNAALYNGEDNILSLFGRDILAHTTKRLREKPENGQEQWFQDLMVTTAELKEMIQKPPSEISNIELDLTVPLFSQSGLSSDTREQIENLTGYSIEELSGRWPFLNRETRQAIRNILH